MIILDNIKMTVMKPPVSENASGIVITFLFVFLYESSYKIENSIKLFNSPGSLKRS